MLPFIQIFLGNNHVVYLVVGKGFDFRSIHVGIHVGTCGLLGKNDGNTEINGREAGYTDAGSFDGQNLIHLFSGKKLLEFISQLTDERYIDLVIQKAVHFQYISRFNHPVG